MKKKPPVTYNIKKGPFANSTLMTKTTLLILVLLLLTLTSEQALAATQPWDNIVQTITRIFTGGLARAIAILAVIILGVLAFMGRFSWKFVLTFIGGLVMVFGATAIVDFFIAAV